MPDCTCMYVLLECACAVYCVSAVAAAALGRGIQGRQHAAEPRQPQRRPAALRGAALRAARRRDARGTSARRLAGRDTARRAAHSRQSLVGRTYTHGRAHV